MDFFHVSPEVERSLRAHLHNERLDIARRIHYFEENPEDFEGQPSPILELEDLVILAGQLGEVTGLDFTRQLCPASLDEAPPWPIPSPQRSTTSATSAQPWIPITINYVYPPPTNVTITAVMSYWRTG